MMQATLQNSETPRGRRAASFKCRLVIMVRAPVQGAVKTRLAREVGGVTATAFYRHAMRAVIARLGRDTRFECWLAVAPDGARDSPVWPCGVPRIAQGGGDLGQRMQRILDHMPPGPVIIVGSDIPAIRAEHVADAFRRLGAASAVLGPASDGGYWLVGLARRRAIPRAFGHVRWSTALALADTARNLRHGGLAFARTHADVDDAHDLGRVAAWHGRINLPHSTR